MRHSSSSDSVRQRAQWPTPSIAAVRAWARRRPPSRSFSRKCSTMRCADFGPTPGRRRKASTNWSIRGLKFMYDVARSVGDGLASEGQFEARRQIEPGGEAADLALVRLTDFAHGVIDGGDDEIFQYFLV